MYKILFSDKATEDLRALKKSEPQAFKKAMSLIEELADHPKTGRGKPTCLLVYSMPSYTRLPISLFRAPISDRFILGNSRFPIRIGI